MRDQDPETDSPQEQRGEAKVPVQPDWQSREPGGSQGRQSGTELRREQGPALSWGAGLASGREKGRPGSGSGAVRLASGRKGGSGAA